MILPPSQSTPIQPTLFPECVPTGTVNQIVQLPEPVIETARFSEPDSGFPSVLDSLAETTISLLQRFGLPANIEIVEPAPNRIVDILELGYEEFERLHPSPIYVRQAVRMLLQCRTSALGGHVERCPDGHIERVWYNSCGHRFCLRCAYRKQQKWLEKQREKILPVRHFHATFTIPHEFNGLWWQNFKKMANILFHSVAQALQELLADSERVGVQIGITTALHTWDAQLLRHPHLHCLVTGGGLTPEGEWKSSWKTGQKPHLVHVSPLMQRFRKLFCRKVEKAVKKGELELPEGCRKQQMLNIIHKVNRTNWQVYIARAPEAGGPTTEQILEYQARAVAGGPISQMRIESIAGKVSEWVEGIQAGQEGQLSYLAEPVLKNSRFQDISVSSVSFWWGEYDSQSGRRQRNQLCTLTVEQFIQRLLWHVPPPNLQSVRSYGLYASAKKAECEQLRLILPDIPQAQVEETARAGKEKQDDDRIPLNEYMQQCSRCPVCGKKLELSQVIPSSGTGKISPRDKALARKLSHARRRRRGS